MPGEEAAAERLCAAVDGLVGRLPSLVGWRPADPRGARTWRTDVVHALVQRVADMAADAEGVPRRSVPRLEPATTLGDQLRVVAADLIAGRPSVQDLTAAAELIRESLSALRKG